MSDSINPVVGVVMGSNSDWPTMKRCVETLDSFGVPNVAKVMRMLWEGFGFGWGETAYSGVTFPLVQPGL